MHHHAFVAKECSSRRFVHDKVPVIDEVESFKYLITIGDRTVLILIIELPETGQDAERHVELAVRPFAYLPCSLQHIAEVGSNGGGMLPSSSIQLLNFTVFAPVAQQSFQPVKLVFDGVEG